MEDIRLLLNDVAVHLPANVASSLRLTKTGTDVSSLDQRSGEASYTLELPFTRTNDRVFAHHRDIQTVDKFNAPFPYIARLYVGGQLFFRGVWQLTSIRGAYIGKLVSDEVDVFAAIGSKTLQDLKFAPFPYTGQHGYLDRLRLSMAETDLQFPLVAYGNYYYEEATSDTASNYLGDGLEVDEVMPAVSFLRTLRQIFADVGWRITGAPLQSEEVRQWCLPHVGEEYKWNSGELLKCRLSPATQDTRYTYMEAVELEPTVFDQKFWVLEGAPVHNPARRYRPVPVSSLNKRRAYLARQEGGYHVRLSVDVLSVSGGNSVKLQLRLLEAGQQLHEGLVVRELPVAGAGRYGFDTTLLNPAGILVTTGQTLVPVLFEPVTNTGLQLVLRLLSFEVTPVVEDVGPLTLDIAANLPAFSQKEFVKGFVTLEHLRFTTDPTTKTLTFYYRDDYELPPAFAIDLSELADPRECEFTPALTAGRVALQWTDDTGDALLQAQPQFANAEFRNASGLASEEQLLTLPWAATRMREYMKPDGNPLVLPCLASADQLAAPLAEVSWSYGYTPRLLRYRGPSAPGDEVPLAFVESERARYGRADFTGLSFAGSGGRYERLYRGYFESLARGHLLKGGFALTPALYAQLTPAVPVLFWGGLYRLSRIPSFTVGGLAVTEVELLRVVPIALGGGQKAPAPGNERIREFYPGEWDLDEYY
jgi:hypothetical protein